MHDHLDPWRLDYLVKGTLLGNVGHNSYIESILIEVFISIADRLCLILRPHSSDNAVPLLQESLEDVG